MVQYVESRAKATSLVRKVFQGYHCRHPIQNDPVQPFNPCGYVE